MVGSSLLVIEMSSTHICCPIWNSIPMTITNSLANNIPKTTPKLSSKEKVKQIVLKQAALVRGNRERIKGITSPHSLKWDLDEAYDRCVELAAKDLTSVITNQPLHSSFNSGLSFLIKTLLSLLTEQEHLKAVAALAVWCRRTDELVDGSNGKINLETLDRWKQRLNDIYNGHPHDICDAALYDTITKYSVDIQLFKDMIEGMRLDMNKSRYENFDELYLYSYYATGTAALMCIQVIGFAPQSKVSLESFYDSIVAFAVALQLTDILRDMAEDARMGRIYLPQDELQSAGISNDDILNGQMSYKWRTFMKSQVERARLYYRKGDVFIMELEPEERWFFWWLSLMYKELLNNIEANGYDFNRETSVAITKQLQTLLTAHGKTLAQQIFRHLA